MKKPPEVRCKNCIFAQKLKEPHDDFDYACHFNPPILDSTDKTGWPCVANFQWCGRFIPVDNLTAVEWMTWIKGFAEVTK